MLGQVILDSLELVETRAAAVRALAEPRKRLRHYKVKHAITRLDELHGRLHLRYARFPGILSRLNSWWAAHIDSRRGL